MCAHASRTTPERATSRVAGTLVLALLALLLLACSLVWLTPPARAAASGARLWSHTILPSVSKGDDYVTSTSRGPSGSMYVGGEYTPAGTNGYMWVGRVDSAGKTLWVKKYDPTKHIESSIDAIATDRDGNVIVVGSGTYSANEDTLVLKYSPAGKLLWARHFDGDAHLYDEATAVAIDSSNSIYVAARVTRTGTAMDMAVLKYSSAGTFKWVAYKDGGNAAPNNGDSAYAIAVDADHNTYVTGEGRTGAASFFDAITFKVSAAGVPGWTQVVVTTYRDAGFRVVYRGGFVYVQGTYGTSGGGTSILLKHDAATGAVQWYRLGAGATYTSAVGTALAVDGSGNAWSAGRANGTADSPALMWRYTTDGTFQWALPFTSAVGDKGNSFDAIAIDGSGHAWVTGVAFDGSSVQHLIAARYAAAGTKTWDKRWIGTNKAASGVSVALFGSGAIAVAGVVDRTTTGNDPLLQKYKR